MNNHYDTLIIGAGHNGLVAAAYLAKKGKKVLVLERRDIVGGQVVTETFGDGFTVDSLHAGGTLRPDIIRDLKLASFGLQIPSVRMPFVSLQADSGHLVLDADPVMAAESIQRFSRNDAAKWPEFLAFMKKASRFIHRANATIMPRLPQNFSLSEGLGLAGLGLDLRRMGGEDMMRIIRGIPMTAEEFVDEWFESEAVKAAVASLGIHGFTLGVMGAGSGYTLMHNWANRGGMSHIPSPLHPSPTGRGAGGEGEGQRMRGVGIITDALAGAVRSFGGEIRTGAEVVSIQVDTYTAKGVVLANGEEIPADTVISALDPKRTFLSLVGPMHLPPEFVWHVQSIRMRGSVAKVHLLTDGGHGIPAGTVALAPSLKYLEKAYDAAKYHQISEQPYLEVTTSGNVVSIHFQFAPYSLKNGVWRLEIKRVEELAITTLAEYFPNLKSSISNLKPLSPLDLEQTYGLTEGDLNHGQLMLDQFLFMRPIPGWSNHRTPIDGLYLCGSGVHGGGGISGAAGRNAARVVLNA